MMKLGLFGAACLIVIMLDFGISTGAAGRNAQDEQTMADLTKFQSYIEEYKPGKKWQTGPARMDSEEIRKAYGKQRFYSVYSSPPMPPGAPLQELVEEFEQKMNDYNKHFISIILRIDELGRITPLQEGDYNLGYNMGMMQVATDEDAKICAAAILSLYSNDRVGPGIVSAKEVVVTRSEKGWSCSVDRENAFQGEIVFDKDGKCVSVTKTYTGPLPS